MEVGFCCERHVLIRFNWQVNLAKNMKLAWQHVARFGGAVVRNMSSEQYQLRTNIDMLRLCAAGVASASQS